MIARAKSVCAQGRDEAFGIEGGFVLEHEIDGACQLDGQHGVGLELIATHTRGVFEHSPPDRPR